MGGACTRARAQDQSLSRRAIVVSESAHQSVDDVINLGVTDARALAIVARDVLVHSQRRDDSTGVHRRVPVAEANVTALRRTSKGEVRFQSGREQKKNHHTCDVESH